MTNLEEDLAKVYIRKLQLDAMHQVIMEAWNDKSKSKTNLKLSKMLDSIYDELAELEKSQLKLEKQKHDYNVRWDKYKKNMIV